jgi:hypothetical protein
VFFCTYNFLPTRITIRRRRRRRRTHNHALLLLLLSKQFLAAASARFDYSINRLID